MRRIVAVAVLIAPALLADIRVPLLISSHMVLQRDVPARVWGTASAGEAVTVRFRGQELHTTANELGRWSVHLWPGGAGGPFDLRIEGPANRIAIDDVLVGDVWVASGQSNMEWPMSRARDAEKEIAVVNNPNIRVFRVAHKVSDVPLEDVAGPGWKPATRETIPDASAVAYFFARHLQQHLKIPIGIVQSAWGGTPAEAWTSGRALANDAALQPVFTEWARVLAAYPQANAAYMRRVKDWEASGSKENRPAPPQGPGHQWQPSGLYNGMIAPLTPYAVRGFIWYQGESNAGSSRALYYHRLFSTMIRDWRRAWADDGLPFLFVQLANYGKVALDNQWALVREAQLQTLALRNTGMAVTIDIGNPEDIHPTNKQDVGLRLALAARAIAYGERAVVYSGPIYRQATREGSAMRLWFDHVGAGLHSRAREIKGFTIAGPDRHFVPAQARIDKNTVVVSSPEVTDPIAVRYGWEASPEASLYNAEGLPASPFRTDPAWF
ncbi:MAG TPA: sialate O-acetylesterase [Bryobacteraceae bacterium]|nr:sialate O-acetylesterase [Bryobacteraceae bacterium]